MSLEATIKRIEKMQEELEAATGVTTVELPGPPGPGQESLTAEVPGEFSCERLELLVEEHMKVVTDMIQAKVQEISELMSKYAPILELVTNPLKILKWAKKVIIGIILPAIDAAIELAIQIAQLAGALAGLIAAVVAAAKRLADCITNLVANTLADLQGELMAGAISLYDQAVGIYEDLKNDALDQLGFNEIKEISSAVKDRVDNVTSIASDLESTVNSIQDSADTLSDITIPGN